MREKVFLMVILIAVVAVIVVSFVCAKQADAYGGDSWCGAFTSDNGILDGPLGTDGVDIAARDNHVYVVAAPDLPGMNGIWFRRSDDYGSTWNPWVRIYEASPWDQMHPQIECGQANHSLWVAFDGRYTEASLDSDITVFRSTNNGDSWGLYHRIASHYTYPPRRTGYFEPSLSSTPNSHNRVMLSYTDRWYDTINNGYYATHTFGFELEPFTGEPGLVSSAIWSYTSRCAVSGDGTYWFVWKQGNDWNGDVYAVHFIYTGSHWTEQPGSRQLLATSSSYPDIAFIGSGLGVAYNRWDGQNNWAEQRWFDGATWWSANPVGYPNCNGGGINHVPKVCHNSMGQIGNWIVDKSGFNGHFWGFAGRNFDQGDLMDLSQAGGFKGWDPSDPIDPNGTYSFDICTNGTGYYYMVAEDAFGRVYVKRKDTVAPQCDSVSTSSSSGLFFGGALYTNTNFDAAFVNVRDDWNVTGSCSPPGYSNPDYATRGVTALDPQINGGEYLPTITDDPDHDGNWKASVDVSGRPDGNYWVASSFRDTAGLTNWSTSSNKTTVDRVPPSGSLSFSGYSGGGTGDAEVYTNKDFSLSFDATDNINITGQEDGGSDEFTHGVTQITIYKSSDGISGWKPISTACSYIDMSPWNFDAELSRDNLTDGTWYIKGVLKDVAGNLSETAPKKIVIDTVVPEVSLSSNLGSNGEGWRNKATTIAFQVNDANPDTVEYKLEKWEDGKGSWETYTGPVTLSDGEHTVSYRAEDRAGNTSETKTDKYKIDTMPPSCAVTEPVKDFIQVGFNKDQKARISGESNDGGSGVASGSLYVGSNKVATGSGGAIACDWDVANAKQGIYEVKMYATDRAGNEGFSIRMINVANFCKDWYFAEGNTLPEFDEWLCIANPGEEGTNVQLSFMLETGEVITREVTVARKARTTYKVKSFVPEGHPGVSARIHCDTQAIIAERAMYFNYKAADPSRNWKGGHASLGLTTLQKEFYFAEGTTRSNVVDGQFDEWLTLQNPGNKTGTANITYMLGDGRNIYKQYRVGPHSRVTVDVPSDVGKDLDVSARVLSDEPIAAERPMYFDYHGYAKEGHNVVGTSSPSTEWLFAEGNTLSAFQMWLTVQNPNDIEAHLTFRYLTDQGKVVDVERTVGPRSRWTEDVLSDVGDSQNFSTEILSDVPVVCERPMYFNYKEKWTGGHDAMGSTSLSTKFYVAEGTTIDGFETWYTIGNPNGSAASVKIKFMSGSGEVIPREFEVAPHSRLTIDVNAEVGQGKDVSSYIDSDKPVMVERPMYFNYGGTRDGGSDSPAYGVD